MSHVIKKVYMRCPKTKKSTLRAAVSIQTCLQHTSKLAFAAIIIFNGVIDFNSARSKCHVGPIIGTDNRPRPTVPNY